MRSSRVRSTARAALSILTRRPLSYVAGPAYDRLIEGQLAIERGRDRLASPFMEELHDVTVLVKTFERPRVVRRLIDSVRRLYPKLAVLVVDDSREPLRDARVETLAMPFDSGLSAGRNAGLARVTTPFFLLCDDDFVFTRETHLAPAVARMRSHPELDVVGGRVIDLPIYLERHTIAHVLGTIAGLERRTAVCNFFLGRTARVRELGWDPALKLVEHADFFTRARGVLTVAYDPSFSVLHARTPFDAAYMAHRNDVALYRALLDLKYR